MVFIDFCCLLQTLTNASAIITGVIQTLLVRIPWAHTFALAKLDSMEMEKSALVTITTLFFTFSRPLFVIYLPAFLDTGLPRGNVHERDSGPMQAAISTQSLTP